MTFTAIHQALCTPRNSKGHLVVMKVGISTQGNDINEVLGNAQSGGWWSNKNGEQRVCVTCACLIPKAIVCTK